MIKNLIINVSNKKILISILKNKKLIEYYNYLINDLYIGDILIGRIKYIYEGMNAVFLDIGYIKYGFLNYDDIGINFLSFFKKKIIIKKNKKKNVKELFKKGDYIIVQVIKDKLYNKGPKLTCKITLIGRYIILIPLNNKIYISKKIKKIYVKKIKRIIKLKLPNFFGCIIRTLAINNKIYNLKLEIYILLKTWYNIFFIIKNKKIIKLYNNNNILYNYFKTPKKKYNKIICNNYKLCNKLRLYLYILENKIVKNIKFYSNKKISIFDKYGINKQKKILFNKYIYLSDGSNLIIEKTETLNIIDINSTMTNTLALDAYKVNLLAVKEIVKQIILRNMGGIIIIDFIDINKKKNKKKIYKFLKKEMKKKDNIKHKILHPSKFNIIEITRERNYSNYKINKLINNNNNNINIKKIEFFLNYYYIINKCKNKVFLYVHPLIATYIKYGFFSYRFKWYFKYKKWINIISNYNLNFFEYKFLNSKNKCLLYADVVE